MVSLFFYLLLIKYIQTKIPLSIFVYVQRPKVPLTIFCVPNDFYKNTIVNDPTLSMMTQQNSSPTDVSTKKLLGRHIITERLEPMDFKNDLVIPSFSGERLRLNKYGNVR